MHFLTIFDYGSRDEEDGKLRFVAAFLPAFGSERGEGPTKIGEDSFLKNSFISHVMYSTSLRDIS